jgi:hypothetical protein
LRLSVNSFRQIQQHFALQHGGEMSENPSTLTSSTSSPSNNIPGNNFPNSQPKNHRHQGAIRERKRTLR